MLNNQLSANLGSTQSEASGRRRSSSTSPLRHYRHQQHQRPASVQRTKFVVAPKTFSPARKQRPQHRLHRERRRINLGCFLPSTYTSTPTPRPPSRLPSSKLPSEESLAGMGGISSVIYDRGPFSTRGQRSGPATPLTHTTHAPVQEADGPASHKSGLTFRKRSRSRVQLHPNPRFVYNGPHTVYQGPHPPPHLEGLCPPPPPPPVQKHEGPQSLVWPEFRKKIGLRGCGIISLTPLEGKEATPVHVPVPVPAAIDTSLRTCLLPKPHAMGLTFNHYSDNQQQRQPIRAQPISSSQAEAQTQLSGTPRKVVYVSYPRQPHAPGRYHNSSSTCSRLAAFPPSHASSSSKNFAHPLDLSKISLSEPPNRPRVMVAGGHLTQPEVPNEIQDDLRRIEMLLELRKYKKALTAQLQAQQRLVQICGSGSSQNLRDKQKAELRQPPQPQPQQYLHNLLIGQKNLHQCSDGQRRQYLMEALQILTDSIDSVDTMFGTENAQPQPQDVPQVSQPPSPPSEEADKNTTTVWERELEKHLNSTDFLNAFMEPHILAQGTSDVSSESHVSHPNPISLYHGTKKLEEFNTIDHSRSEFPSGLTLGGAGGKRSHSNNDPNATDSDAGGRVRSHQSAAATTVPKLQRQYLHYHALDDVNLFPERMQTLSPNNIEILEAKLTESSERPPIFAQQLFGEEDMLSFAQMLRKPVAVRTPTTPSGKSSPAPGALNTPVEQTRHFDDLKAIGVLGDELFSPALPDDPSPFFPGFSPDIKLRIRTPDEQIQRRIASSSNVTGNEKERRPMRVAGGSLEEMEELEKLLSKLPVLSRKQKVEEFAFQTLKPASPVAVGVESETSMIPHASSQGTLATGTGTSRVTSSIGRPETSEVEGAVTETEDDLKHIDTAKMSISELVNLGRKIYRILSQLNTASNKSLTGPLVEMPATPLKLELSRTPSPKSIFTPNMMTNTQTVARGKSVSHTNGVAASAMLIDFNSIPNPTFVTGPGLSKSQPKVSSNGAELLRVPLKNQGQFRKTQPPPTRWGDRGQMTQTQKSERRSISSISSSKTSRSGGTIKIAVEETKALPRFSVHNRYSNNRPAETMNDPPDMQAPIRRRRLTTPIPQYNRVDPKASSTTNGSLMRSPSASAKRNFIQENITRVKNFKKNLPSRLRSRPLPPVKNRYENVPSTIQSRSRSRSLSGQRDELSQRRSSSLPLSTGKESQARFQGRTGTAQSSGHSSLSIGTSRSPTRNNLADGAGNRLRNTKTRILPKLENQMKSVAKKGSYTVKRVQKKASGGSLTPSTGEKVFVRKSRSKTKRLTNSGGSGRSSSSSIGRRAGEGVKRKPRSRPAQKRSGRVQRPVTNDKLQMEQGELSFGEMLTTESDQALIRHMVKAEMDEIMMRHMQSYMKKTKTGEERQKSKRKGGKEPEYVQAESDTSMVPSDSLAPVYTPPRVYDESLFSLERWINPDMPSSTYNSTSAKDTPTRTPNVDYGLSLSLGGGQGARKQNKLQTVRFSLPQPSTSK